MLRVDGICGVTPEIRKLIVKARRNGKRVKDMADIFDVSRKTVWKWCKKTMKVGRHVYRDRSSKPHRITRKISSVIEEAILLLCDSFHWGTQRIMVALFPPPSYIRYQLETILGVIWKLSDSADKLLIISLRNIK